MKSLLTILIIVMAGTCGDAPEPEIIYDTIYVDRIDTIDITDYDSINELWDYRTAKLGTLYTAAMEEVTSYRVAAIHQVDSMREDLFFLADSIKDLHIYDNMIIRGDTLAEYEAKFDSSGKPYLLIKN